MVPENGLLEKKVHIKNPRKKDPQKNCLRKNGILEIWVNS